MNRLKSKIWDFQSSKNLEYILLGYHKMWSYRPLSTFGKICWLYPQGWKSSDYNNHAPNLNLRLNYVRQCAEQVHFHSWQRKKFFLWAILDKRTFLFGTDENSLRQMIYNNPITNALYLYCISIDISRLFHFKLHSSIQGHSSKTWKGLFLLIYEISDVQLGTVLKV
jgi:hypothetical protein